MARALIVGCGCRGRTLGEGLVGAGWRVRGTSRTEVGTVPIAAAGIEPAVADPDAIPTILDQIEGVALVFWLLGSAQGETEGVRALHNERLERLLEEIVDTPVRGIVYEAAGSVPPEHLSAGTRILRDAADRWRIPIEIVAADAANWDAWRAEMLNAADRALQI